MSRSTKEIVSELVNAVTAGDAEGILKNLADDVTWTFFGNHRFAGTLRGKEELMAGLFAVVGEVLEDSKMQYAPSLRTTTQRTSGVRQQCAVRRVDLGARTVPARSKVSSLRNSLESVVHAV